jgi:hypothetical protein
MNTAFTFTNDRETLLRLFIARAHVESDGVSLAIRHSREIPAAFCVGREGHSFEVLHDENKAFEKFMGLVLRQRHNRIIDAARGAIIRP